MYTWEREANCRRWEEREITNQRRIVQGKKSRSPAGDVADVYSFGILLLEIVGGRKNVSVTNDNTSQVYFPEWIYNFLKQK